MNQTDIIKSLRTFLEALEKMEKTPKEKLQIRNCPFCSSDSCEVNSFVDSARYYVECNSCGAKGPNIDSEKQAILDWNDCRGNDV